MALAISIHTTAPEPVYEQIVRQIHGHVNAGRLKPGMPLPTVRQLATDLRINRNTVARAYKLLEDQGVLQTAGRKGTFVRADAVREVSRLRFGHAERVLRRAVEALRGGGLSRKEISTLFETVVSGSAKKV